MQHPKIEITPEMIEAGVLAFSSYDCRFEPCEAALTRNAPHNHALSGSEEKRNVQTQEAKGENPGQVSRSFRASIIHF